MNAAENAGRIIDLMEALKASLAKTPVPPRVVRCDRIALLRSAAGKEKQQPVPAGVELRDYYDISGVRYQVVDVLLPNEPETSEG